MTRKHNTILSSGGYFECLRANVPIYAMFACQVCVTCQNHEYRCQPATSCNVRVVRVYVCVFIVYAAWRLNAWWCCDDETYYRHPHNKKRYIPVYLLSRWEKRERKDTRSPISSTSQAVSCSNSIKHLAFIMNISERLKISSFCSLKSFLGFSAWKRHYCSVFLI